jgi:hypothetical protein
MDKKITTAKVKTVYVHRTLKNHRPFETICFEDIGSIRPSEIAQMDWKSLSEHIHQNVYTNNTTDSLELFCFFPYNTI